MGYDNMLALEYFKSFPYLRTDRLQLRPLEPGDAQIVYHLRSSGVVGQFIERPRMKDEAEAEQLIEQTIDAYKRQKAIAWTGILRDGRSIIGACGLNHIDHHNLRAEVGGELLPAYWGKGIAEEAFRAIIDFGFRQLGLHAIEGKVMAGNRGAIHILEKMGFEKEGHFKNYIRSAKGWKDLLVYTQFSPTK